MQQAHGLEAHRLAARVGTGDQEDVLLWGEGGGQGDDGASFLAEGLLQQRMAGLPQQQFAVFGQDGHACDEVQGHARLRHQEVDFPEEDGGGRQVRNPGAQELGELVQDARDLAGFGEPEFGDLVGEGDDLGRFDEGGLAGGGLVIDETRELALLRRGHRNQHLAVPDGDARIGLHEAVLLRLPENGVHPLGDVDLAFADGGPDLIELVRRRILDLAVLVQDAVDAALDFREARETRRQLLQARIDAVLDAAEEVCDLAEGVQHRPEPPQGEQVDGRVLADGLQEMEAVDVAAGGEVFLEHEDETHLVGELQALPDDGRVRAQLLVPDALGGIIRRAAVRNEGADPVETELAFQSSRRLVHGLFLFVLVLFR